MSSKNQIEKIHITTYKGANLSPMTYQFSPQNIARFVRVPPGAEWIAGLSALYNRRTFL